MKRKREKGRESKKRREGEWLVVEALLPTVIYRIVG